MEVLDRPFSHAASFRDNTARAKTVYWMMLLLIPLTLVSLLSSYQEYRLLDRAMNGILPSDAEATANDLRQAVIGIILLGYSIALIVTFILWFRRAYYNAHALQIPFLSYNEGRAAGGWFIPFANLYQPYKIATEIWDGFHYAMEKLIPGHQTPGRTFILVWWLVYIFTNTIENVITRIYIGADTIDELHSAAQINMYSGLISFTAIIAVLFYLRKMHTLEAELTTVISENGDKPLPWVEK